MGYWIPQKKDKKNNKTKRERESKNLVQIAVPLSSLSHCEIGRYMQNSKKETSTVQCPLLAAFSNNIRPWPLILMENSQLWPLIT